MSKHRREWTAYGVPQIASRLGRLSLGLVVTDETGDSSEILTGQSPSLYWISKATVDVASGLAANGVPNHTFAELLRSSDIAPSGLMCFEKPLGSIRWIGTSGEIQVSWDAVMWGPVTDTPYDQLEIEDRPIYIALLSRMAKHRYLLTPDERQMPLQKCDVLLTTSNQPFAEGQNWTDHQGEIDESESTALDTTTALMTSVLLTAGQPRITGQRVIGTNEGVVIARRDRDEDRQVEPEVVLVDVLRPPGAAGDQKSTAKRKERRDFDHRWWVRGYYRMQPYGPRSELRKFIYVEPHTAGPDDKPLSKAPRVNIIRTDPP